MVKNQAINKQIPQLKPLTRTVNYTICILALLMFIAGTYPSVNNWGINHLAFYSSQMRFLVPLLLLLLLLPSVRLFLVKHLERMVNYVGKQKKSVRRIGGLIFLIAMGFLFWTARTATHFLGDGYTLINIQKGMGTEGYFLRPTDHEPLTTFFVFLWNKLLSAFGGVKSAELAYRVYSISCGIACIPIVWKLTSFISKERVERVLLFLFLLASGASQLFFGYVENYTLAYTGIFLFILVSVSYLNKKTSIVFPILVFPLLVAAYFAAIIFLPALFLLVCVSLRRKEIKVILLSSVGAVLLTIALMWILGYTPAFISTVLDETKYPMLVPLTKISTTYQAYTLFSAGHAIELVNLFVLVQPIALVLLLFSGWLRRKQENKADEQLFLVLMIAGGIFFLCVANSWLGISRDWDALAVFNTGISVAAVFGWFGEMKEARFRRELLAALTVAALVQTGLWIGINASESYALQRIDMLKEDPRWSARGVCNFNEARGNLHVGRREYEEATKCYARGLALEPANPRFLSQLVQLYVLIDDIPKSSEMYKRMEATGYANAAVYSDLGSLYLQSKNYDEALKSLFKAESLDSTIADVLTNIGSIYILRDTAYQKALPYYLRAIELDPSNAVALANTASCYKLMGDPLLAQKYSERYAEVNQGTTHEAIKIEHR